MVDDSPGRGRSEVNDLRPELLQADDRKIRRVLAVVDNASDPALNKALLDPLRPRLATLKPVRPLRFARLLFIPIDPLTVPAREWRLGDPTVPRTALAAIATTVRTGLGELASVIDKMIAGRKVDAIQAVTEAGQALWPRAAEILAEAPIPAEWIETGLPRSAYAPLAASIAAVLRRAVTLRCLAEDQERGALAIDDEVVVQIMRDIAGETEAGCAMIARLIMLRSPHAARLLWRTAGSGRNSEEKAVSQQAIDQGLEAVLSQMERDTGFVHEIRNATLADVGGEVRRVTTLLRAVETEPAFAKHWPRLKPIRAKLGEVCGARFTRGLMEGLVAPLAAASGPLDGAAQTELEAGARDLRKLETEARKLGEPATYDRLLLQAAYSVRCAAESGALSAIRKCRLIEIVAGPEAAEALYNEALARP
jgi:hypothetical protein